MKAKSQLDFSKFVPYHLAYSTLFFDLNMVNKFKALVAKYNIVGNLTWEEFERLDKEFALEFREYATKNKERFDAIYTKYGANRLNQNLQKMAAAEIKKQKKLMQESRKEFVKEQIQKESLFDDTNVHKQDNQNPKEKKTKAKPKKSKANAVDSLIKKKIETLTLRELKSIIVSGKLEPKDLERYYIKFQEFKKRQPNYNKPQPIKAAKALLTFEFAGKANPIKWVQFDEIIKAKLYSAKMGIQFLEDADPAGLNETLVKVKPKLDEVIKALGYNSLNEINF
jgi:hypothetical protein